MKTTPYILFFFLILIHTAAGQEEYNIQLKKHDLSELIPRNSINSMTIDERGKMWFSNFESLFSYNGYNFAIHPNISQNIPGRIAHIYSIQRYIVCIFEEETNSQFTGYDIYDTESQTMLQSKAKIAVLPFLNILRIQLVNDKLIIETKEGIYVHSKPDQTFFSYGNQDENSNYFGISSDYELFSLSQTPEKTILSIAKKNKGSITRLTLPKLNHYEFPKLKVDTDSFYIVTLGFTKKRSIIKISKDMTVGIIDSVLYSKDKSRSINIIGSLCSNFQDEDKVIIINKGKIALSDLDGDVQFMEANLDDWALKKIYKTGNFYWISVRRTIYEFQIRSKEIQNYLITEPPSETRGIQMIDNKLFVSSYSGLYEIDLKTKEEKKIGQEALASYNWNDSLILYSCNALIKQYNPKTKKSKIIFKDPTIKAWSIMVDKNNSIWFSDTGLQYFQSPESITYEVDYGNYAELKNATIYSFIQRTEDTYYLCSTKGIFILDIHKGITDKLQFAREETKNNLKNICNVRHLHIDSIRGKIWIGTKQDGLLSYDEINCSLQQIRFHNESANTINALYSDHDNNLWLSTENGVIKYNPEKNNFFNYRRSNGLSTLEMNRTSHFQDKNGILYFGSVNGVNVIDPKTISAHRENNAHKNSPIYISNINNGENIISLEQKQLNGKKSTIYIPKDLEYISLNLGLKNAPVKDKPQFMYKRAGESQEWMKLRENKINIYKGQAKNQHLIISAISANGHLIKPSLELELNFVSPFYKERHFFISISVFITSLLLYQIRLYRIRFKKDKEITKQSNEPHNIKPKQQTSYKTEHIEQVLLAKREILNNIRSIKTNPETTQTSTEQFLLLERLEAINLAFIQSHFSGNYLTEIFKLSYSLENVLKKVEYSLGMLENNITLKHPILSSYIIQGKRELVEKSLEYLIKIIYNQTTARSRFIIDFCSIQEGFLVNIENEKSINEEKTIVNVYPEYKQKITKQIPRLVIPISIISYINGKLSLSFHKENNNIVGIQICIPTREIVRTSSLRTIRTQNKTSNLTNETRKVKHYTILIIEENIALGNHLYNLLNKEFNVLFKNSPFDALNFIPKSERKIDLILTALEFEEMNGILFMQIFLDQSKNNTIPVIALGERNDDNRKIEAFKNGFSDFLSKPVNEEELLLRIQFHLSKQNKAIDNKTERPYLYQQYIQNISKENQDWLRQLEKCIINKSSSDNISSAKLSEELLMSRTALFKKIKDLTGFTLNNYIKEVQLQRAFELLNNKEAITVKEIAFKVGFKDPKYFTKQFKIRFGILPNKILKPKNTKV